MARQPAFAGSFYERNYAALDKQITECFTHEKGPGELPVNKRTKKLKAIIAPHAGYAYSGPCAAWAYKEIAESEIPDLYIIIGPNHAGTGSFVSVDLWQTPYGEARVDKEFVRELLKQNEELKINEDAHQKEHSIEVQLPFLFFSTRDKETGFKFVPIILDHDMDYKTLALDIKETLVEMNKTAVIIISSDLTHFGPNYHNVPYSFDVQENIYAFDKAAMEFIQKMDAEGFLAFNEEKLSTVCGQMPIAVLLRTIKASKVNLEQYYTSADITDGKYKNSVSYASMVFY
jgi:MEMO1 family protein